MARPLPEFLAGSVLLAGVFLAAGCAGPQARERVVRSWDFDAGRSAAPQGEFIPVSLAKDGRSARVASAVRTRDGRSLMVRLPVVPPQPVGSPARLRFRCRLTGAATLTVQMFDVNVQDNRHIALPGLPPDQWLAFDLDFTRDSRRNDGTHDDFPAGSRVDDVFFFIHDAGPDAHLSVDDVVLYSPMTP